MSSTFSRKLLLRCIAGSAMLGFFLGVYRIWRKKQYERLKSLLLELDPCAPSDPKTITELWIYPVKSLRGISVQKAKVEARGLENDRRWMIVDEGGIFVSQRKQPRMALLQVELLQGSSGGIRIFCTEKEAECSIKVPLVRDRKKIFGPVRLWDNWVDGAINQGKDVSKFLTDFLGASESFSLVFMDEEVKVPVDPKFALKEGDLSSFADGYPYLVANTNSLKRLSNRLIMKYKRRDVTTDLKMNRFRPNIVVRGLAPFEEDHLKAIDMKPSNVRFAVVKPCPRCKVTTVNQESAAIDKNREPLVTLGEFKKIDGKVFFGQNVICENLLDSEEQWLSVGDAVIAEKKN